MQTAAIGPFTIEREIGRGGMGEVYLALDTRLDRRVAIKALPAHLAQDPDRLARFQREAKLLASLSHPNIGAIHGLEEANGHQYLILEFIEGGTLSERLKDGAIPVDEALVLAKQMAEAIEVAHEKGIIHRDLKPGNVMIGADGAAKVMDFGIAHQSHAAATRLTQTLACGTPPYMPPEQVMGSVSKASDLYALGVMAYELVTGARPFDGPDFLEQKIQRRYAPATTRVPSLPAGLDAFFAQALEPDPTKRHADAAAFAAAFERACDATPRAPAARA